MSDYRKLHLYHINKQIAVGGDVLDAPFKTIIANLTSIGETNNFG